MCGHGIPSIYFKGHEQTQVSNDVLYTLIGFSEVFF